MHQQANTAHRRNEVFDTWVTHQIEERALGSFFPSDFATVKAHGLAMWVPICYLMRKEATRVGGYQSGTHFFKDGTGILA